ncbi:MAG: CBS domain-containing protein [Nitrososphaerales archaeon]|jgi:CBS domain-containing protein
MDLKADLERPVIEFTTGRLLTIDEAESTSRAAKKMAENGVGALVVSRGGEPVGIVTERDILNKVVAAEKDASKTKVSAVMSTPIRTIDSGEKVGAAISIMAKSGIRRLGVVKNGKVIGIISQRSIMSSGGGQQVLLPELEAPSGQRCPYCLEVMKDQKELSRHIDMIHIGKGLLQGDLRRA